MFFKSIKDDHADGNRSGSGLSCSILGDLELPSQKNRTFITIWRSWFSYEFPLLTRADLNEMKPRLFASFLPPKRPKKWSMCKSGVEWPIGIGPPTPVSLSTRSLCPYHIPVELISV